jgi:hypothetical protein
MACRNFGIARQIKLAQMPPLPPFPQMVADMDGFCLAAQGRGSMCIHEEKLTRGFRPCHYP